MIKVNVLTEEKSWSKKIKKKEFFFNQLCRNFPKKFKFINKRVYLTLLLSNNRNIKRLNKKFRKKDKHTDVLSFPLQKKIKNYKEIYLGDIIINYNKINYGSNIEKFKFEFDKLWIHGLVHLFGHDHKSDRDFFKMQKIEKKLLSYLL